jgi:cysteine desulfurase/selenocysteine lyase
MRNLFPIFTHHPDLVYLDSAATTHKPQEVIDTISRFYAQDYGTVHRAIYQGAARATEMYEMAREEVRAFLNAPKQEQIVFTRGTTDAINLIAATFPFKPGDEIVVSPEGHHSNLVPWQMAAQRTGATLRFLDAAPLSSRTRLLAVPHLSNVTGAFAPVKTLAQQARQVGALLLLDGAQSAPHHLIDVQALDCDFFAFSGHKCYGPTGIGVLYGRHLDALPPLQGGGDMIEEVTLQATTYQPPPLRFEAGTPPIAQAIGLAAALRFCRTHSLDPQLIQATYQLLLSIPDLQLIGPQDRGPIFTFYLPGIHPLDLATLLDQSHIAIRSGHLCAQPLLALHGLKQACRLSLGLYNSKTDLDRFHQALLSAIKKLR